MKKSLRKATIVAQNSIDNAELSFLPDPGEGRFWEVKYSTKIRTKPLHLALKQPFRKGSPLGEVIGFDYAEANEKSLKETADLIMVRTADYKKYLGVFGA